MVDYYKFEISCPSELSDILVAFLGELPFDTFQENENGMDAFMPTSDFSEEIENQIEALKNQFNFTYQKVFIKGENWNKIWESNFHPILVGNFCGIRADFHEPLVGLTHEIVILPKMAFGTGHHSTTFLMMQLMEHLPIQNAKVLDYGCGTGILAILASMLNATTIEAVDIELPAYQNTIENCQLNHIENVLPFHGTLDNIVSNDFEIILANINRNVIINSLEALYQKLKNGGSLVISGFVEADKDLMKSKVIEAGFSIENQQQLKDWCCWHLIKNEAKSN